ncbi:MAG TPA: DUF4398 domain-containing protein [Solimonas sp.]|nr:DUF4398 domain-containing protein [Solimonas sp.]
MNNSRSLCGIAWLALAGVACSSSPALPTAQLDAAGFAVAKAAAGKPPPEVQPELQRARSTLEAARAAALAGDSLKARRLAEQARSDAELAIARGEAVKAQRALDALQKGQDAMPGARP